MSKRIATYQISDRTPVEPEEEESNYNSSGSESEGHASERQIRQRKISKPKQRAVTGNKPAPSLSNLFAGLPTNPFQASSTSSTSDDRELKMRGLNKSFVESAQKLFEKAPSADFSKLFQQYEKHLASFAVNLKAKEAALSFPTKVVETTSTIKPLVPELKPIITEQKPEMKSFTFDQPKPVEAKPVEINFVETKAVEEKPSSTFTAFTFGGSASNSKPETSLNFSFAAPKVEPVESNLSNFSSFTAPKVEKSDASNETATPKLFSLQPAASTNEGSPMKFNIPTATNEIPAFKPFSFDPKKEESASTNLTFKPFSFGDTNITFASTTTTSTTTNNDNNASNNIADSTPKFSFGTSLPTFSFGATSSTAPSTGFSFSLPAKSAANASGDEDGGDEIPAEEAESFTLTRNNSEQLKTGAGEENETCQHEERCKVFMMDSAGSNGWIDLGVGIFKINRYNNEIGKSRILCRAEGSGKVILNTFVTVPGMDVSSMEGKKEVALLAFGPEGKPTKYLIRVKTLEQATALKTALNSEIDYAKANK